MHVLSSKNIKTLLILLVRNAIANLAAKHHLVALCKIVHRILQFRHIRLLINKVKVNHLVGGDLDSNVTFDEVDETTHLDLMVEAPLLFTRVQLLYLLEEQHAGG